ncbi:MAG: YkgJ family cysteine cluster protein [Bacteroidota bacterium]
MKITPQSIDELKVQAEKLKKENSSFFRQLAGRDPGKVDAAFHRLHEEVFEEVVCLDCGNCCKSLGPRITDADIRRISSSLKIKASELSSKYLRMDEDNDYVFRQMPCPFLDADNYCKIYENRPRACRDYPHTDRRRMQQVLDITLKNTSTCPAVFEIVERLKKVKL